jgi:prepilin-type N-terminal cleavage/methylation domain-containing protein
MICRGFTLVELLVVITIIVVLLALLAPALDRAIYQADLVRCAANQRVVSTAATNYAFSSKRSYPHRPMPAENTDNWLNPNQLQHPFQSGYDLRPMLRDELGLKINENMQCPLVTPIDLDERPLPDEFIFGNQAMWFGWHYQLGNNGPVLRGMKRLGDRFEWQTRDCPPILQPADLRL